jgi:hypothetical protein
MLLRPNDKKGVIPIWCLASVAVAQIAVRSIDLGIKLPIHKDALEAIRAATGYGDVVPVAVCHEGGTTKRLATRTIVGPEGEPAGGEGDAIVAIVARPIDVTVEEDVAKDPVVSTRDATWTAVLCQGGLHPPL